MRSYGVKSIAAIQPDGSESLGPPGCCWEPRGLIDICCPLNCPLEESAVQLQAVLNLSWPFPYFDDVDDISAVFLRI